MIKKNYGFFILVVSVVTFFGSCEGREMDETQSCLGIAIPPNVKGIKYSKRYASLDYKRPYNIYIKFKLDSQNNDSLVKKLGLVSYDSDFRKLLCLEKDYFFTQNRIWEFKTQSSIESESRFKKDLPWWNPHKDDLLLYASFYKEGGRAKIVHCYNDHWDGRLLLGYDKKEETVYILIEVFMGK